MPQATDNVEVVSAPTCCAPAHPRLLISSRPRSFRSSYTNVPAGQRGQIHSHRRAGAGAGPARRRQRPARAPRAPTSPPSSAPPALNAWLAGQRSTPTRGTVAAPRDRRAGRSRAYINGTPHGLQLRELGDSTVDIRPAPLQNWSARGPARPAGCTAVRRPARGRRGLETCEQWRALARQLDPPKRMPPARPLPSGAMARSTRLDR